MENINKIKNLIITPATVLFNNDTNEEMVLINGEEIEIVKVEIRGNGDIKEIKIQGEVMYANQDGIKILSERFIEWDFIKEIKCVA